MSRIGSNVTLKKTYSAVWQVQYANGRLKQIPTFSKLARVYCGQRKWESLQERKKFLTGM
jgi:hypothetical protein